MIRSPLQRLKTALRRAGGSVDHVGRESYGDENVLHAYVSGPRNAAVEAASSAVTHSDVTDTRVEEWGSEAHGQSSYVVTVWYTLPR